MEWDRSKRQSIASLAALALIALIFGAIFALDRLPEASSARTIATVTGIFDTPAAGISLGRSPYEHGRIVTFRTKSGLAGSQGLPAFQLACRKGDRVAAVQTGTSLRLADGACRYPLPSASHGRTDVLGNAGS